MSATSMAVPESEARPTGSEPVRTWAVQVAAGREAVAQKLEASRRKADAKWRLGDLALEVEPMGATHARTGSLARLREYAEEIGEKYEALIDYRDAAFAWPPDTRRSGSASWSAHRELRSLPHVMHRLAEEHEHVTRAMARSAREDHEYDFKVAARKTEAARAGPDAEKPPSAPRYVDKPHPTGMALDGTEWRDGCGPWPRRRSKLIRQAFVEAVGTIRDEAIGLAAGEQERERMRADPNVLTEVQVYADRAVATPWELTNGRARWEDDET